MDLPDWPVPEPTPAAEAAVRCALAPLAATIVTTLPGVIEATDPERLHEARVAIRQTRTILRELADFLPADRATAARELFSTLATATGEPRDLDVYLSDWERHLEPLSAEHRPDLDSIRVALQARRDRAHQQLGLVLHATATTRALESWSDWLQPEPNGSPGLTAIATSVGERVARLHHRLLRDGRRIAGESPAAELHELRKRAKRLRYLVECFAPLYAPEPRRAFLAQLKDLQDNLGAHQDAEVQVTYLRILAREINDGSPDATDTVLAVGRLSAIIDDRRNAERHEFTARFARFDRKRTVKLLEALLTSARLTRIEGHPDPSAR